MMNTKWMIWLMGICVFFAFPSAGRGQSVDPSQLIATPEVQKAIRAGKITLPQIQECMKSLGKQPGEKLSRKEIEDCIKRIEQSGGKISTQNIPADVKKQVQTKVEQGGISTTGTKADKKTEIDAEKKPETEEEIGEIGEKPEPGKLSPAEIRAGREALEQKEREAQIKAVEEQKKEEERKRKAQVPEKVEDAFKKVEKAVGEVEETFKSDEDFFKKVKLPERSMLEPFGHNLFAAPPATFEPLKGIPVTDDYVIGPGDEIVIMLWGRIEDKQSLEVDNEGIINFPKIGPLTVAGLTFGEVKDMIRRKVEAITGVNVNISMGKLKTIQVFALGEVKNPGIYMVSSLASVTNVLLSCGGPTHLGTLRKVELKRGGQVIKVIDLYDFIVKGDVTSDIRLMPGDVIFVPQVGPLVAVSGNVKREAVYELKDNRTLSYAIDIAGGLAPVAFNQRIQIERFFQNKEQIVLDIPYEDAQKRKDVELQDGDLIRVFSVVPLASNAVYLYGNVLRPGQYAYKPGIRVRDVIPNIQSLDKDTYYDYALIRRYRFENMKAELVPFNLGKLLFDKDESQNITLMPKDEIYVFNKNMFEDKPYAEVKGQVRNPGRYFIDDMRVRDLIRKAGDLKEDAYLAKGEVVRYDKERNRHTLYFDVAKSMANDPAHNIPIQHQDIIIIHSIWEQQWQPTVRLRGEVKHPGEISMTKDMRIKDLLFKGGGFTRDAYIEVGHIYRTDWRTKDVTIFMFNPAEALAENIQHNMLLEDQDEVVIHNIWEYKNKYTVSITGQVNIPGEYPYATNMTIKDLILVAGNVKYAAYLDEAELVRFMIVDGKAVKTEVLRFNVNLAQQNDPAHNLKLEPMDVVTIKAIPDWWEKKKTVTISGEVFFPGTYQIRKDERLSDLIERAGGFTEYSYLQGAVFTRESAKKIQQARMAEMIERLETELARTSSEEAQEALTQEDLSAQAQYHTAQKTLVAKLKSAKATGRVVIQLKSIEELKGTSADIVLEDGDTIQIPSKPYTVNVLGAVYNPGSLIIDENQPELQYYLNMTGGPTDNADTDMMYVIRANGMVDSKSTMSSWWKKFENTKLYAGDTVLVPERIVRPNYMRDMKDITQILYQIAVTAGITITQVF